MQSDRIVCPIHPLQVLAGKRFMTSDLKAIGFYSASDLKTLHLALELPDMPSGTKATKVQL